MTKEQIQQEYLKLLKEKVHEEDKIVKEAKKKGTWKPGLDGNSELFKELNDEFNKKVELLKTMADE